MAKPLGAFETMILLALVRLGEGAYGVSIQREIATRAGREVALGALYTTLERLERKGYVASTLGEPTAARGGRRKKLVRLQPAGARALSEAHRALRRMTAGLEPQLEDLATDLGSTTTDV